MWAGPTDLDRQRHAPALLPRGREQKHRSGCETDGYVACPEPPRSADITLWELCKPTTECDVPQRGFGYATDVPASVYIYMRAPLRDLRAWVCAIVSSAARGAG